MKVLQINATYEIGSTGQIVKDISSAIIKNGGESFCAFQSGTLKNNSYKFNSKFDRYFHAIYTRIFGMQAYASKYQTRKFLSWVDKIKPDIIHLHNLHSNYININLLLRYIKKNNIATVITMHDCWYFTGKCTHYVEYSCNRWQTSCGKCPQKNNEIKSLLFDRSKKVLLDRKKYITSIKKLKIIGCSSWIKNECKKSVLKNCDIDYIYNGIDTSIFAPTNNEFKSKNNLQDKFLILGFATKWNLESNKIAVENIISSLKENDRVILVGCSEQEKKLFSKYKKLICVGFIKNKNELADIYSSCDVFINLTHADTLPTVNMESICSGTPVITYNVCGSPELVDKDCGFIENENDYKSIIKDIDFIRKNGFNIDIEKYKQIFDKNKNYDKYIDVYRNLLK